MNENGSKEDYSVVINIIGTKLDQILVDVKEIKDSVRATDKQVEENKMQINTLIQRTDQQQKEINTLYEKNEKIKQLLLGAVASIITGLVLAGLRFGFGI